jgi:hypothetical protein
MSKERDRVVSIVKEINPPELISQKDRLNSELSRMDDMGVLPNLLSIYDDIKKNPNLKGNTNVPNSLLVYCMGITSKHPDGEFTLEKRRVYGRDGWPDIDMDFCYERRHEVIEYLIEKYGRDKVANIGTVQTLKTKSALRRVIRAVDPEGSVAQGDPSRNFQFQNEILNTLPKSSIMKRADGTIIEDLQQAYDEFSEFRRYMDKYPQVFEMAKNLEGGISAWGAHAAGIVISPIPLSEICPLHVTKGMADDDTAEKTEYQPEKMVATQFSMSDVESVGLIKMDILGLSTKTAINLAVELIKQNHSIDVDVANIPLDDKLTINLLKSGHTDGCFQLEEVGMKQTIQQIDIDSFGDLMIAIAMYRPGPKDYIPEIASRKKGQKKIDYPHPLMEKITKETYGIMSYQEEVMQVFMSLADLPPSEGYTFMKGCAKKKKKLIQDAKDKFIKGAVARGVPKQTVQKIWGDMEKFGGYAFNKSLSHNEKIITSEKDLSIQELYNRKTRGEKLPNVYSPDGKSIRIADVYDHGVIPVWEVIFSDGSIHKCSMNHRFLTTSGVLPLHDILKHKVSVIQNAEILHAQKERLDLFRMPGSFDEPPAFRCPQTGMQEVPSKQKTLRMPGLLSEVYKKGTVEAQERMCSVEISQIRPLLTTKLNKFKKILGSNTPGSYTNGGIQKQGVDIGIVVDSCKSNRETAQVNIDVQIKPELLRSISKKSIRHSSKNIRKTGHTKAKSHAIEEMERRESREVYENNQQLAISPGMHAQNYIVANGIQTFSNSEKSKVYIQVKKKTNRFYGSIPQNSSRIRWTVSFLEQRCSQIQPRETKGFGGKSGSLQQRISSDTNVLRCMEVFQKRVQKRSFRNSFQPDLQLLRKKYSQNNWKEVQIIGIKYVGMEQCYDLEVDSPEHLYCLSSGIINSNSHACAYAYESWKTAYLKAHFPVEFVSARMTVEAKRRKFDYVEKCERDATSHFGIKILPIDLNKSKMSYTITGDKELRRPLIIKDIGDKAAEEIIKHQPYDVQDLFYSFASVVGPAVNTRVIEALCDAKLFGDIKKAKALKDFDDIKNDRKKSVGRQTGDIFGSNRVSRKK